MAKDNPQEMSEELEGLVSKAVRPDQRLKAEDLVASELASAILSEPLSKIRHTVEALMLLDENERKSARITEEEIEEASKIYALSISFQNTFIVKYEDEFGNVIERCARMRWPFHEEDLEEWKDWIPDTLLMWYSESEREQREREKIIEEANDPYLQKFKLSHNKKITMDSFNEIKTKFIMKAMPPVAKLLKKIISLVSSSSFQEALKRLKGGSY